MKTYWVEVKNVKMLAKSTLESIHYGQQTADKKCITTPQAINHYTMDQWFPTFFGDVPFRQYSV